MNIRFIEITALGTRNHETARAVLGTYGFKRFGVARNTFEVWKNGANIFVLNFDPFGASGQFASIHGGLVLSGIGMDTVPSGLDWHNFSVKSALGLPLAIAPGGLSFYFDAGRLFRSFLTRLSLDSGFVEAPVAQSFLGWDHIDIRTETVWNLAQMVSFLQIFGLDIQHLPVDETNLVVAAQDKSGTRIALPHPLKVDEEVIRRIPGVYLDHAAIIPFDMVSAVSAAVSRGGEFSNPADVLPDYYAQLRKHPYARLIDVDQFEALGVRAASWEENEGNLLVQAYSEPVFPENLTHAYTSPSVIEFAYRLGEGAEQQDKIFPVHNPATQAVFASTTKTQVGDGQ